MKLTIPLLLLSTALYATAPAKKKISQRAIELGTAMIIGGGMVSLMWLHSTLNSPHPVVDAPVEQIQEEKSELVALDHPSMGEEEIRRTSEAIDFLLREYPISPSQHNILHGEIMDVFYNQLWVQHWEGGENNAEGQGQDSITANREFRKTQIQIDRVSASIHRRLRGIYDFPPLTHYKLHNILMNQHINELIKKEK